MNEQEWNERLLTVLAEEAQQPLRWFYLSFAGDDGFLGAAIVQAAGPISATQLTHELGINPGGQVLQMELPDDSPIPEDMKNRLLSKEEVMNRLKGKRLGDS